MRNTLDERKDELIANGNVGVKKHKSRIWSLLCWIIFTVGMIILFRVVFPVVVCTGTSMQPNYYDSDIIVGSAIHGELDYGDVVIFDHGEVRFIKRVVGLPGDVVNMDPVTCEVTVNGEVVVPANTVVIAEDSQALLNNAVVPEDHVFLLGDNYAVSQDSRYNSIGMVDEDLIACVEIFHIKCGERPNE